ncbi:hypothetical protein ES708_09836 [subsurface metagenome]
MKQLMRMGRFNKIINKGKLYHGDTYVTGKCLDEPPLTNLGLPCLVILTWLESHSLFTCRTDTYMCLWYGCLNEFSRLM